MPLPPKSALGVIAVPFLAFALAQAPPAHASTAPDAAPRGCATMLIAGQTHPASGGGPGTGVAARVSRTQAATHSARTLVTQRFALHYTLAPNIHRVKLTAPDASLKASADSIRATLSASLSAYLKDSTVHARLDSMGAQHPQYVQKAAEFLERAWEYYDSLGMRMPEYPSTSGTYLASSQGRYVVDIADVNASSGLSGPYYGLAWPPNFGGFILLENDFLYAASFNTLSDMVSGSPVRAFYPPGTVYRNYAEEWEMGLKVTASHEFYHSVQYAYLPVLPGSPHAWYELSATAMEERLAPEVNDYFQYLPYNVANSHQSSLFTQPPANANYGNGIFHTFLTGELGADFDVAIWERLGDTTVSPRNNLALSLLHVFGQAKWDSLYAAYAAAMSISGTAGAAESPLAFSPDMALWPKPRFDSVPENSGSQLSVPALTFRLIRPPETGTGIARLSGISGAWRVDSAGGAGYGAEFLPGTFLPVAKAGGASSSALAVANPSFSLSGQALLAKAGVGIVPSSNPVSRAQAPMFFLSSETTPTDSVLILSESGRRMASLATTDSGAYWTWDLTDAQGRIVPPGLYFFGIPGQAPRPLLVLP